LVDAAFDDHLGEGELRLGVELELESDNAAEKAVHSGLPWRRGFASPHPVSEGHFSLTPVLQNR
jgi:hypothetical protein